MRASSRPAIHTRKTAKKIGLSPNISLLLQLKQVGYLYITLWFIVFLTLKFVKPTLKLITIIIVITVFYL